MVLEIGDASSRPNDFEVLYVDVLANQFCTRSTTHVERISNLKMSVGEYVERYSNEIDALTTSTNSCLTHTYVFFHEWAVSFGSAQGGACTSSNCFHQTNWIVWWCRTFHRKFLGIRYSQLTIIWISRCQTNRSTGSSDNHPNMKSRGEQKQMKSAWLISNPIMAVAVHMTRPVTSMRVWTITRPAEYYVSNKRR